MRAPRLILVTDPAYGDDEIVRVVEATARRAPAGAFAVQLRDKVRPYEEVSAFAARLREVTRALGVALSINGEAALAKAVGAEGVHLGGGAMSVGEARRVCGPLSWISIAAHSDAAVRAGAKQGADAALVSPIFATSSGSGGGGPPSQDARSQEMASMTSEIRMKVRPPFKAPRGVSAIRSARKVAPAPAIALYALGGVTPATTRECLDAGADGVAVIRALLAAKDVSAVAEAFFAVLR